MTKSVKRGVISVIKKEFELPILIDEVEQNVESPCFMIKTLTNSEHHVVMERYQRDHAFMIQYIPENDDCSDECEEVSERLMDILRIIPLHGGYAMNKGEITSNVVDGVLNVEVKYELFIKRDIKIEPYEFENMENLSINQNAKE